ncbi:hypothetical protein D3C80_1794500 [compost metagenome]
MPIQLANHSTKRIARAPIAKAQHRLVPGPYWLLTEQCRRTFTVRQGQVGQCCLQRRALANVELRCLTLAVWQCLEQRGKKVFPGIEF